MKIQVFTVENIPLIKEGDDIASIICENTTIEDNDIVVIASTIVAKAEGRMFRLEDIIPGEKALTIANKHNLDARFVQAVLDRSKEVLVDYPIFLVETQNGHVCIKAGIDDSNVNTGYLADLPSNPDESAGKIGTKVEKITGKRVSVILTDTNGRAFKIGQTGIAIGVYKIHPIKNWKGQKDLFGNILEITEEAIADEIAGAANLLMGEGDGGYPVVIVRGLQFRSEESSVQEMYRSEREDIVKKGLRCLSKV
ncbi:coenzyme F420-0:L-glutamate ligase [Methanolobus bombayensis]|uniref:coenzyme F420-0:L-glutamate ligase n=1 Tax=Methanolobus bombayensis TaxID=38023 RepID=UPI001FD764FE|nr:coenzyme F420-0:L-glutamate ligase [Methanolobus bombayensis]MBP1908067.1 coenzyme F420-0:L-glutamate ligase/coenzyme F420-1:gamma-L-glutamate ligase [Methanolobus bombayensis]